MGLFGKAFRYAVPKVSVNRSGIRFGNHFGGVSSSWSGNPRADFGIGPARARLNYGNSTRNRTGNAGSDEFAPNEIKWLNTEEEVKEYWDNAPPELIPWEIRFFRWQDANEKKREGTHAWAYAFTFLALLFGSIWLFGTYGARIWDLSKHWILIQALPMSILAMITYNWLGQLLKDFKRFYSNKLESGEDYKIPFEAKFRGYVLAASPITYAVIVHTASFNYWFLAFAISLLVTPITYFPLRIYLSRPSTFKKYLEQSEQAKWKIESELIKAEVERVAAEAIRIENQAKWNTAEKARVKRMNAEWAERNAAVLSRQKILKDKKNGLDESLARLAEVVDKVFSLPSVSEGVHIEGSNKLPESLDKALRDAFSDVNNHLSDCQGKISPEKIAHHQSGLYRLRQELEDRFGFKDI